MDLCQKDWGFLKGVLQYPAELCFAEGQLTLRFALFEGVPIAGSLVGLSKSFDDDERLCKSIILN